MASARPLVLDSSGTIKQLPSGDVLAGVARVIACVFDGNGAALAVGAKAYVRIPQAGTITKVTMLADVSGSAVVDVWKDTYANYPPTVADSIAASAKPTISGALKSEDATLTGWTLSIAAGDVIAFNLDSCTTITRLTVEIEFTAST